MKHTAKKLLALLLALGMSASLVACGGGEIGGGTATPEGTTPAGSETPGEATAGDAMFDVVLTSNFTGFDPLRTNDAVSTYVNAQIYETLYLLSDEGEFIPLLAEGQPTFSDDGLSMTVKLKEGILFHDGTPFNAEAVKYTFELIKDPDFGSARASLAGSIDSIETPDEYTVVFNLLYEDGVMLAKLAHTNSAIVSPTAQQAQDLMIDPVGTGPYKFVSSISGANVVLTRNDEYWNGPAAIKDVTMTVITDESTALARLETGEADFVPTLTVEALGRAQSIAGVTVTPSASAQIYYMALRPTSSVNPLMANEEFRSAIAMSLDTEGYVNYILENNGTHARSIVGPKVVGYTEAATAYAPNYDPAAATAILDANGWHDEPLVFLVPSNPNYTPMGEYFHANLTAAGFTNVTLEPIDWSAWLTESKEEGRFDMTLAAWSNVTRDGSELLEPNWDSEIGTRNRIGDAEFDAYVEASKTTSVMEDRIAALEAANIILLENYYAVPVVNGEYRFAYNSDLYSNVTLETSGTFRINEFTIN